MSNVNAVLLVEDETDLREIVAHGLRTAGYEVTEASNGKEAIDELLNRPLPWFALVTDFKMPLVTGGELVKSVRHYGIKFDVTIMATASFGDEPDIAKLMAEGEIILVQKPYQVKDILKILICSKLNKVSGQ
jgi:two-component system KDP operon response regulator KdpE